MKVVNMYNGTMWLSTFTLDEDVDDINNETIEYICSQAINKGIPFDYINAIDVVDEEDYAEYYYVDLSAYNLDNIYVNLIYFDLK